MKKHLITITTTLSAILIVSTATYAIGTLTPTGTAGDNTQYSLNDIYTKLTSGDNASEPTGSISVPSSVSASFRTLTEIYNSIPATLSINASTTTIPVGINRATTTLDTIDTDLTAENIKSGTTIFGVEGSAPAGAPTLEWSTYQGSGTWTTASTACSDLVEGGHTDWRLPTISELLAAISDDWIVEGDNEGDRFADYTNYWSGTEYDGSSAWSAYWDVFVYNSYDSKVYQYSVRCVH